MSRSYQNALKYLQSDLFINHVTLCHFDMTCYRNLLFCLEFELRLNFQYANCTRTINNLFTSDLFFLELT